MQRQVWPRTFGAQGHNLYLDTNYNHKVAIMRYMQHENIMQMIRVYWAGNWQAAGILNIAIMRSWNPTTTAGTQP
jgi:hypothetical protein